MVIFMWILIINAVYLTTLYFKNKEIKHVKKTTFLNGYMCGYDDGRAGHLPSDVGYILRKMERETK